MPARVVHCEKDKFDVYIGRNPKFGNTKWGNPYRIGLHGSREQVMDLYETTQIPLMIRELPELIGKTLG